MQFVEEQSKPFVDKKALDPQSWDSFLALFDYVRINIDSASDYLHLAEIARKDVCRVFYLATSPDLFTTICDNLAAAGLVDGNSRVVLEKPLGHDLASAQAINASVGRHFAEAQIYRIDHYLGKETVQNLMVLRFGNAIFGPLWQAPYIKSVQITVAETVGVGSRAGFTTRPARCATWFRITCCNCCASWPWSRLCRSTLMPCAMKSSRCCVRCAR